VRKLGAGKRIKTHLRGSVRALPGIVAAGQRRLKACAFWPVCQDFTSHSFGWSRQIVLIAERQMIRPVGFRFLNAEWFGTILPWLRFYWAIAREAAGLEPRIGHFSWKTSTLIVSTNNKEGYICRYRLEYGRRTSTERKLT